MANDLAQRKDRLGSLLSTLRERTAMFDSIAARALRPEKLFHLFAVATSRNPKLLECSTVSLVESLLRASQLGLDIGGVTGQAYLVPFKNRQNGTTEAQFIIGYKGMLALFRRSGKYMGDTVGVVREGDEFTYYIDSEKGGDVLRHKPSFDDSRPLTHAYYFARLRDGGFVCKVVGKADIDKARKRSSRSGSADSPWSTDFEAMCIKTAIRRAFPLMDIEPIASAVIAEEIEREEGRMPGMTPLMLQGTQTFDDGSSTESLAANAEAAQEPAADVEPDGGMQRLGNALGARTAAPRGERPAEEDDKPKTKSAPAPATPPPAKQAVQPRKAEVKATPPPTDDDEDLFAQAD